MGEATTRRNAGRRGDVRPVVLAERRRAWPFWCYTMVFSSPPPLFFQSFLCVYPMCSRAFNGVLPVLALSVQSPRAP